MAGIGSALQQNNDNTDTTGRHQGLVMPACQRFFNVFHLVYSLRIEWRGISSSHAGLRRMKAIRRAVAWGRHKLSSNTK